MKFCSACAPIEAAAAEARRRAKRRARAKPCRDCGRRREDLRYVRCAACRRNREQLGPCSWCGVRPRRAKRAKLCEECTRTAPLRSNARKRRWDRLHPERQKPSGNGRRASDTGRMSYRLRTERKGQVLKMAEPRPARGGNWNRREAALFPDLPPQPLARAIIRLAEREVRELSMMSVAIGEKPSPARGVVALRLGVTKSPELCEHCAPAGHAVPSCPGRQTSRGTVVTCDRALSAACSAAGRRLYAWEHGEVASLRFDVVDRVLTAAGWLWFDVYEPCPEGLEHRQAITAEGECPMCRAHALAERAFTSTAVEPQLQLEAAA